MFYQDTLARFKRLRDPATLASELQDFVDHWVPTALAAFGREGFGPDDIEERPAFTGEHLGGLLVCMFFLLTPACRGTIVMRHYIGSVAKPAGGGARLLYEYERPLRYVKVSVCSSHFPRSNTLATASQKGVAVLARSSWHMPVPAEGLVDELIAETRAAESNGIETTRSMDATIVRVRTHVV